MVRSRLAWAGSTVAPWGIALGMLVSITAQADQEGPAGASSVSRGPRRLDILSAAAFHPGADSAPSLIEAHLTLGDAGDLSKIPDEIEPKAILKPTHLALPGINRDHKGDPFIALRPGLDARAHAAPFLTLRDPALPADARSPTAAGGGTAIAARIVFGDGATPTAPLDFALNSSSPSPSDGKLLIGTAKAAAQTTIATQGLQPSQPNYAALIDPKDSARQMRCLAEAVYFESRSEPEAGQAAVAQVVLNRVRSGIFPTDVCGVVYQDRNRPFACQFSFACEGKSLRIEEPESWAVATRIADEVVRGVNYNPRLVEALNYHATYVYPFWAPSLRRVDKIGMHVFYQMKFGLNWAPGALNGRGDLPPLQQAMATPLVPVGLSR